MNRVSATQDPQAGLRPIFSGGVQTLGEENGAEDYGMDADYESADEDDDEADSGEEDQTGSNDEGGNRHEENTPIVRLPPGRRILVPTGASKLRRQPATLTPGCKQPVREVFVFVLPADNCCAETGVPSINPRSSRTIQAGGH